MFLTLFAPGMLLSLPVGRRWSRRLLTILRYCFAGLLDPGHCSTSCLHHGCCLIPLPRITFHLRTPPQMSLHLRTPPRMLFRHGRRSFVWSVPGWSLPPLALPSASLPLGSHYLLRSPRWLPGRLCWSLFPAGHFLSVRVRGDC